MVIPRILVLAQFPLDVTVLDDRTPGPVYDVSPDSRGFFGGFTMADRFPVTKYSSARSFERSAGHTRTINFITPLRGGWRL